MKLKIFITAVILFSSTVYSQWATVSSGTTNFLTSVHMASTNKFYAAGFAGTVLFSSNQGATWVTKTSPSGANINEIFFPSTGTASTGWVGSTGLWKSTDSGNNWVNQFADTVVNDVNFPDVNTGYFLITATSSGNFLRKTTNGGTNWARIQYSTKTNLSGKKIETAGSTTFYILATTADSAFVFKSTNSGANWTQNVRFTGDYFNVMFLNQNTGVVCGEDGKIQRTTNGGTNWTQINTPVTVDLVNLIPTSNNAFYCVGGNGTIIKSTNTGANWFQQTSGTSITLRGVDAFGSQELCISVGGNGTITRTLNGGLTTVFQTSTGVPDKFSLAQNYPNPFNPETNISFTLPKSSYVTMKIFDITGKEIEQVVNDNLTVGSYTVKFNAENLPSGTYFCKMITDGFSDVKKLILIK